MEYNIPEKDTIEHLDIMLDFYFKVFSSLSSIEFNSEFKAMICTSVQMMFTKGKALRNLLEGIDHSVESRYIHYNTDHTVLFSIVRTAYEQLCTFELLCILPDSDEKKLFLEKAYIASGEWNRLKMIESDNDPKIIEEVDGIRQVIDECKQAIHSTDLFKKLSITERESLNREIFKNGNYQILFKKDGGIITHVGWDEMRKYIGLNVSFDGIYRYVCNMAHPSYIGLSQFYYAHEDFSIKDLNDTALTQMLAIMSVFIMDYLEVFPEAKNVYERLNCKQKGIISKYNMCLRNVED